MSWLSWAVVLLVLWVPLGALTHRFLVWSEVISSDADSGDARIAFVLGPIGASICIYFIIMYCLILLLEKIPYFEFPKEIEDRLLPFYRLAGVKVEAPTK